MLKILLRRLPKTFSENSSVQHYLAQIQRYKTTIEKQTLNFVSNNAEDYNLPFTMSELVDALHSASDSSPGPDNIHY